MAVSLGADPRGVELGLEFLAFFLVVLLGHAVGIGLDSAFVGIQLLQINHLDDNGYCGRAHELPSYEVFVFQLIAVFLYA